MSIHTFISSTNLLDNSVQYKAFPKTIVKPSFQSFFMPFQSEQTFRTLSFGEIKDIVGGHPAERMKLRGKHHKIVHIQEIRPEIVFWKRLLFRRWH
ncbi:hypothetical protein A3L14_04920 [Thermococcus thioreducens]|uniref:Uncharacterized protein n=1 Tax=Thermococcus thioreducens TaxID=277988 RepID=A0A0Q2UQS1_9EURY|nr:hypothetical protein A3L14_04920 [Thermococcus thioreducens]KQH83008.1 hypothetical protein AMR53_01915 [Thermococcus thioreducens]